MKWNWTPEQISRPLGVLVNNVWGKIGEIRHASNARPSLSASDANTLSGMSFLHLVSQLVMALHFCNLALLTHPSNPNIFSSFKVGALELADPDCPLFLLTALLSKTYPYFFQGPRLSTWAPLFLYLASHLPSLSCLVREHSLFCSKQFNHGMVQFILLGHPSSVISSSICIT